MSIDAPDNKEEVLGKWRAGLWYNGVRVKHKGEPQTFNLIQRRLTDKPCDGPYEDGGNCGLHAVVTVHGPGLPMRHMCSHCFFEFIFHFGYCDAKVTVIP